MSRRRLIQTIDGKLDPSRKVKIYRCPEWDEYQAELLIDGVLQPDATYYTGDYDDARDTAVAMANHVDPDALVTVAVAGKPELFHIPPPPAALTKGA